MIQGNVAAASIATGADGLYECDAVRIRRLVCAGCAPKHRKYCNECKLERYIQLCIEVVNGLTTVAEIEGKARRLTEDCLRAANERSDRETGYKT